MFTLQLEDRIKKIRLIALDSDGVLTDSGIYINSEGFEFRKFNIKDGLGIKLLIESGFIVAVISSSSSEAVFHRANTLGIDNIFIGVQDKLFTLQQLCSKLSINLVEVAYIGDDLPDIPVLESVGFSCCPNDAIEIIKGKVHYISGKNGGQGAVRDICDLILGVR